MTLSSVKEGDIVLADVKGREFYALVRGKDERMLRVRPINKGVSYFTVTAREVVGHWRRSKRTHVHS